jgi:NADH-quinone oxidoreductase subunit N
LIGVPLTAGFFGKFIFKAALDASLVWLTVLGLLNSAVAAYYYLRILVVMYFRTPAIRWRTWMPRYRSENGSGVGRRHLILGIFPVGYWISPPGLR